MFDYTKRSDYVGAQVNTMHRIREEQLFNDVLQRLWGKKSFIESTNDSLKIDKKDPVID